MHESAVIPASSIPSLLTHNLQSYPAVFEKWPLSEEGLTRCKAHTVLFLPHLFHLLPAGFPGQSSLSTLWSPYPCWCYKHSHTMFSAVDFSVMTLPILKQVSLPCPVVAESQAIPSAPVSGKLEGSTIQIWLDIFHLNSGIFIWASAQHMQLPHAISVFLNNLFNNENATPLTTQTEHNEVIFNFLASNHCWDLITDTLGHKVLTVLKCPQDKVPAP